MTFSTFQIERNTNIAVKIDEKKKKYVSCNKCDQDHKNNRN